MPYRDSKEQKTGTQSYVEWSPGTRRGGMDRVASAPRREMQVFRIAPWDHRH